MPFDNTPQDRSRPERRKRPPLSKLRLKFVIVQAALEGAISRQEAEDLLAFYGLEGE